MQIHPLEEEEEEGGEGDKEGEEKEEERRHGKKMITVTDGISSPKTLISPYLCKRQIPKGSLESKRNLKESRFMMSEDLSFLTSSFLKPNRGACHLALTVCIE